MLLFICHYIWRTTTKTKLHSNNNNDNKNINPHMSYWKLSNLCTWSLLLLLMCNCVVAKTTKWYMKHMLLWNCVVATTTKWYMKHNKDMNKNINLHTCSVQLHITQSFCCCCCFCHYSVILLLQQQNYTWETPIGVLHLEGLTFAVRCTQVRCLMRKVVSHN